MGIKTIGKRIEKILCKKKHLENSNTKKKCLKNTNVKLSKKKYIEI